MNRRVVPLSGATLDTLPADCRRCRYWELGIAPGASARHPVDAAARRDGAQHDAAADKRAWIEDRLASGGVPGWTVQAEGETVAYALAGPAAWFHHPRDRPVTGLVARPAPPPDTTLLATLHVARAHRDHGFGTLLVHAALRDAVRVGHDAVVAYGDRRHTERACYLPATWLLHVGFTVHLEHPRTPLLRLDTSRAARWAGSLEQAFEELLGRLPRRVVGPVPIGDTRPVPGASSTTLRARPLGGAPGRGPVEAS